jgi:hypothetical protein
MEGRAIVNLRPCCESIASGDFQCCVKPSLNARVFHLRFDHDAVSRDEFRGKGTKGQEKRSSVA